MKIVLIGFMGSGKSTAAALLAPRLGLELIEMDDLILAQSGRATIRAIFENDGEEVFRRLESAVAVELSSRDNAVISCGGGVISNPDNLRALKKGGAVVIFLSAAFETLCRRLQGDQARPLFQDRAKARQLWEARLPGYQQAADRVVATDGKTAQDVAEEIRRLIGDQSR